MVSIHLKIHANVIRHAWTSAPEGRAKNIMLGYAKRLKTVGNGE